nr:NAD(P)-dependent oxidoreductase [Crenobacter cavernae]
MPGLALILAASDKTTEETAMDKIGFVGLGLMGQPMTRRLIEAGFDVTVWNRSPDKCAELVKTGATLAKSLGELVERVDVVMTCVSDTAAVEAVVFGENGVAEHGAPAKLLIDFSSIEPSTTRELAERLQAACGMHWVDAPVSGGTAGAENGTLVIMAGGREEDVERLRPLAAPLSQRLTRMGGVGAGQVTKVCNQLIVAANAMLIAEAVTLAEKSGVDASQLAPALAGGFADSKPFQILSPRMAAKDYEPVQWKVATLLKDLDNATKLAREVGGGAPLAGLANQLMRVFAEQGNSQRDLASVIELYQGPAR